MAAQPRRTWGSGGNCGSMLTIRLKVSRCEAPRKGGLPNCTNQQAITPDVTATEQTNIS